MDEDRVAAITALLADECARTILAETATQPLSADELGERCDVSPPTVYRRLHDLVDQGLLIEQTKVDAEGHHYKVYSAALDRMVVDLTEEGFSLRLTRRERMADRFTQFIEDMK